MLRNLHTFVRWGLLAAATGLVIGGFSTLFAASLRFVTDFRTERPWMIFFLPLAGIFIVFLYGLFQYKNDKGTNMVLSTIHAETELPFKMAPLIFISTVITHLFGGSAGREGAALQLGGSIGNQLGRWFRLDDRDRRILVMCGMSAAFSAIFGTPIAAVVFAMEVVSVGVMYYAALVPCVFASLISFKVANHMGIGPNVFHLLDVPSFQLLPSIKVIVLAMLCAGLSVLFCIILHSLGDVYRAKLKNPYVRIVFSAVIWEPACRSSRARFRETSTQLPFSGKLYLLRLRWKPVLRAVRLYLRFSSVRHLAVCSVRLPESRHRCAPVSGWFPCSAV